MPVEPTKSLPQSVLDMLGQLHLVRYEPASGVWFYLQKRFGGPVAALVDSEEDYKSLQELAYCYPVYSVSELSSGTETIGVLDSPHLLDGLDPSAYNLVLCEWNRWPALTAFNAYKTATLINCVSLSRGDHEIADISFMEETLDHVTQKNHLRKYGHFYEV